jgi:hypothetical protein
MGKRKSNKKLFKNKQNKSKKRVNPIRLKGGFPFGIVPTVVYNDNNNFIDFVAEDRVDLNAYAETNNVYPRRSSSYSDFNFGNVYDKTYDFFHQDPSENIKFKKVKIAINTDDDVEKINVLNKMIRNYNNITNIKERQLRAKQQSGGGSNLERVLYQGLSQKERDIGRNLLEKGVFKRVQEGVRIEENNDKPHSVLADENETLKRQLDELTSKKTNLVLNAIEDKIQFINAKYILKNLLKITENVQRISEENEQNKTQTQVQQGVQQPGVQQPGVQQPGVQQPGVQQPGVQQPGVQQPGPVQQPVQSLKTASPILSQTASKTTSPTASPTASPILSQTASQSPPTSPNVRQQHIEQLLKDYKKLDNINLDKFSEEEKKQITDLKKIMETVIHESTDVEKELERNKAKLKTLGQEELSLSQINDELTSIITKLSNNINTGADDDRLDQLIKYKNKNPEYIEQEKVAAQTFMKDNAKLFQENYDLMFKLIPINIKFLSIPNNDVPFLKRLRDIKALWLIRTDPASIVNMTWSDLLGSYNYQGKNMILQELIALYVALPDFTTAKQDKLLKEEWKANLFTLIKQKIVKPDPNLEKKIQPIYSGLTVQPINKDSTEYIWNPEKVDKDGKALVANIVVDPTDEKRDALKSNRPISSASGSGANNISSSSLSNSNNLPSSSQQSSNSSSSSASSKTAIGPLSSQQSSNSGSSNSGSSKPTIDPLSSQQSSNNAHVATRKKNITYKKNDKVTYIGQNEDIDKGKTYTISEIKVESMFTTYTIKDENDTIYKGIMAKDLTLVSE